jgi:transposase-like protein
METPKTLRDAILWFAGFENCRTFMVELRWPDGVVACPRCGAEKVTYLEKQRVWKCYAKHERPTFSLKTGTIFEDSPIPLEKWLCATWLLINCKNGVSSYEVHRALGVTQKSAWFMLHRIRLAMQNNSFLRFGQDGGPVEVDEAFISGKPKNMHLKKRKLAKNGMFHIDKPGAFGMLDRETRQVRAKVVPSDNREVLQNEILDQAVKGSKVFTGGCRGYEGLTKQEFIHETVNHLQE